MESIGGNELRSETRGSRSIGIGLDGYQLTEEFQSLMTGPPISGNSFTALLELPANQAMEILHSSATDESRLSACDTALPCNRTLDCASTFLCNTAIERASKYSVFPNGDSSGDSRSGGGGQVSPEASSTPSDSSANVLKLKCEPADNSSNPNSSTQVSDSTSNDKTMKRKEREKKGKNSSKKSKKAAEENLEDGEKLPYVHVRARRGQATDSHSLAERARRGKINARMKLLQELVPGCHKISGTALMLDEIINHVQSLQHQVEYLSMKLATVDPRINFNLDRLFMAGNGSVMDSNILDSVHPLACPDPQINGERQPCQQQWGFDSLHQSAWPRDRDHHSFITPHNSLLSYNTSSNSGLNYL